MEGSSVALIGAAGVIVGAIIGFLMARLGGDSQSKAELIAAREALDHYRSEVADHFKRSGALIAELTNSYRNVYQHMADGAQQLCSAEVARSVGETMQTERLENQVKSEEDSEVLPEKSANEAAIAAAGAATTAAAVSNDVPNRDAASDEPTSTAGEEELPAETEESTKSEVGKGTRASDAVGDAELAQADSKDAIENAAKSSEVEQPQDLNVTVTDFEPQRRAG